MLDMVLCRRSVDYVGQAWGRASTKANQIGR
jgi:hypothetical protein